MKELKENIVAISFRNAEQMEAFIDWFAANNTPGLNAFKASDEHQKCGITEQVRKVITAEPEAYGHFIVVE